MLAATTGQPSGLQPGVHHAGRDQQARKRGVPSESDHRDRNDGPGKHAPNTRMFHGFPGSRLGGGSHYPRSVANSSPTPNPTQAIESRTSLRFGTRSASVRLRRGVVRCGAAAHVFASEPTSNLFSLGAYHGQKPSQQSVRLSRTRLVPPLDRAAWGGSGDLAEAEPGFAGNFWLERVACSRPIRVTTGLPASAPARPAPKA